jgi:mannose-6-phosphate isomerase-like protein (cupin superfamily)
MERKSELKSTLKIFNEADVKAKRSIVKGQAAKRLLSSPEHPSERLTVALVSFEPGTVEGLHWHLIEAFYYVISGRAVVRDIEGKSTDVGPGSVIYAPAGIAGSHEWEIKEKLQLIGVRATADPEKRMQFQVDPVTKTSSIELNILTELFNGSEFKSLY